MTPELIQVPIEDGAICLNVENNSCFVVKPLVAEALDMISQGYEQSQITEHMTRRYGPAQSQQVTQHLTQMERQGLFQVQGEPVAAQDQPVVLTTAPGYMQQYTLRRQDIMALVMHLTNECNLKCDYCYFREQALKNVGKPQTMTEDVAFKAVDMLLAQPLALKHRYIWFFGGEPLLCMNLIEKTVEYAQRLARQQNIRVSFGVFTNGALLTDETIRYLVDQHISIQVSLDGPASAHDQARKQADSSGSHAQVMARIRQLLSLDPHRVSVRATLTHYNLELVDLVKYFLEQGFEHIEAEAAVGPAGATYALTPADRASLMLEYEQLAHLYLDRLLHGQFFNLYVFTNLMLRLYAGVGWQRCMAGTTKVTVSPDGALYACPVFIGSGPAGRVGDVWNGIDAFARRRFVVDSSVENMAPCKNCWARHLCGGGCRYCSFIKNGSVSDPDISSCELLKRQVELSLWLYGTLLQKAPSVLAELQRRYSDGELAH